MSINIEYNGRIAIITLDNEKKLNTLSHQLYSRLAQLMREVAARNDIYITLLTGKGRYFSAYAIYSVDQEVVSDIYISGVDMTTSHAAPDNDQRRHYLHRFVNVFEVSNSFSTHPKILITALNGPVVGLSAAIIAHSDFIYATPQAYLLTPYSSLGLVAEGGSSWAFVQRLGISKANEVLLMSKRIVSEELVHCGFVNRVFETDKTGNTFLEQVVREINERLGENLNGESLLKIKALVREPYCRTLDAQMMLEMLGNVERYMQGIPQEAFKNIATGKKKHKL
ncbi:hypothetical protein B7463_g9777, partial [Scytalidium lignicola]